MVRTTSHRRGGRGPANAGLIKISLMIILDSLPMAWPEADGAARVKRSSRWPPTFAHKSCLPGSYQERPESCGRTPGALTDSSGKELGRVRAGRRPRHRDGTVGQNGGTEETRRLNPGRGPEVRRSPGYCAAKTGWGIEGITRCPRPALR
ncbi:hypothetical protein NDU88_002822 [Pleurodeles waltl]|uniref:Uncharacterized protein n=1 Tax=Pleurodeles waltl TaxID=8319 RepID=A0AAV7NJ00_PLEWA|nr:hypothetical protein NDU88_002822 [Pleurodeles waltl]